MQTEIQTDFAVHLLTSYKIKAKYCFLPQIWFILFSNTFNMYSILNI